MLMILNSTLLIKDSTTAKNKLVNSIHEIQAWCASMRLKLNASQTELIWFDRHAKLSIETLDMNLDFDAKCIIHSAVVVCDLGVLLDSQLSMSNQIASVARACYFHLLRIHQVKRFLNEECLYNLAQVLIISRLDYCNYVRTGLPDSILQPVTKVLHTAARLVKDLRTRDHVTQPIKQLHWLLICARISFKINLICSIYLFWFLSSLHVIVSYTVFRIALKTKPSFDCQVWYRLSFNNVIPI